MNNSTFLQGVFSKNNTNILLSETVNLEHQLRVIIEDIKSERNTHLELDLFYEGFDRYQDLQLRKAQLQTDLARFTSDHPEHWSLATALTQLTQEENQMRANILEFALTLDQMQDSANISAIKSAYMQGQLKRIDGILPEDHLLEQLNRLLHHEQQIQQVSTQLVDNANEFMVKAEITNLDFERPDRFEKAIFYFERGEQSAQHAQNEAYLVQFLIKFAYFLQLRNQPHLSYPRYERALEHLQNLKSVESSAQQHYQALISNNLALLLSGNHQFTEALPHFNQALQFRKQLLEATQNPAYREDLAATLNGLGELYRTWNKWEQARPFYEEALDLRRELALDQSPLALANLAESLNNFGNLLKKQNDFQAAQTAFREAFQLYNTLSQEHPNLYLADVAMVLNNQALLLAETFHFGEAHQLYDQALDLYQLLLQQEPQRHLPDFARTLNNQAVAYAEQHHFAPAQAFYEQALEIYRQLAGQNPKTYFPYVPIILNNLANLLHDAEQPAAALALLEEALSHYRTLAQADEAAFQYHLAATLNNLGRILQETESAQAAIPFYEEALAVFQALQIQSPNFYQQDIALLFNNLGNCYGDVQESAQAELFLLAALQQFQELAQLQPQTYLADVAMTTLNLAIFYQDNQPNREKSLDFARETLQITRTFGENSSGFLQEIEASALEVIREWGEDGE